MSGGAPDTPHIQVFFFSSHEIYKCIPATTFSVPSSSTDDDLNNLVNAALQAADATEKPVKFNFIIQSSFFRGKLDGFLEEHGIATESVVRIECILQEPTPSPHFDAKMSDVVNAVNATERFILCGTLDGIISVLSHEGEVVTSWNAYKYGVKSMDVMTDSSGVTCVVSASETGATTLSKLHENNGVLELKPTIAYFGHIRSVECIKWSSDGKHFVSGDYDGNLKVWTTDKADARARIEGEEMKKRKLDVIGKVPLVTLNEHRGRVTGVAWLPESTREVVTVGQDGKVCYWDLEMAGTTRSLSQLKSFSCADARPVDGMLITGSLDGILRTIDPRNTDGAMFSNKFRGHRGSVIDAHWSSHNSHLFASCSLDRTTKIWDDRCSKTSVYDLKGHTDYVLTCDWSLPNMIVSGSQDRTVKVFSSRI